VHAPHGKILRAAFPLMTHRRCCRPPLHSYLLAHPLLASSAARSTCCRAISHLFRDHPEIRADIDSRDSFFWYLALFKPWTKRARIPVLRKRSNQYGWSREGIKRCLRRAANGHTQCPRVVGVTIVSDGLQVKITVHSSSLSHPGPPNIDKLPKRGYQVTQAPLCCARIVGKPRL
jgi:hypothetical protein